MVGGSGAISIDVAVAVADAIAAAVTFAIATAATVPTGAGSTSRRLGGGTRRTDAGRAPLVKNGGEPWRLGRPTEPTVARTGAARLHNHRRRRRRRRRDRRRDRRRISQWIRVWRWAGLARYAARLRASTRHMKGGARHTWQLRWRHLLPQVGETTA